LSVTGAALNVPGLDAMSDTVLDTAGDARLSAASRNRCARMGDRIDEGLFI
jgi:hypothetical protein